MIVADASLLVDYLLDGGERGVWANEQVASAGLLHAPHLVDLEVASATRRAVAIGRISRAAAEAALRELARLALVRYGSVHLLARIWQLRDVLTPYDAAYVALAEALSLPLATTDRRLAHTPGHGADVVAPFT